MPVTWSVYPRGARKPLRTLTYTAVLTSLLVASACSGDDDRPAPPPSNSGGRENTAGSAGSDAVGADTGSGGAESTTGGLGAGPGQGGKGADPGPAVCGDGVVASFETCDDANTDPGDGCAADCLVEPGYTCGSDEPCHINVVDAPCEDACFDADACVELGSGVTCECPEPQPEACAELSFRSLVHLEGYTACSCGAVSSDGTTVAGSCSRLDQNSQETVSVAVIWDLGRGVRAVALESDRLVLNGINADGSVLVGSDGQSRALRISDGKTQVLAEDGAARGTSADGNVVVGYAANQAFRWDPDRELELLEGPDGETQSYALAVNAEGSLIVGTVITAAGQQAVRWNADAEAELLPVPDEATASEAIALSDDGAVIVGTAWVDDEPRAIVWTDAGFELLQGPAPSNARGVSALGTRIVGVANGEPGIWDGPAEFASLREVLTDATLDDWLLRDVSGTSADGELLVGNAEFIGANASQGARAFVAVLP